MAIENLRKADPASSLADHYDACFRFREGDKAGALEALAAASQNDRFADNRMELMMSRHQSLLENGCSDGGALALSAFSLGFEVSTGSPPAALGPDPRHGRRLWRNSGEPDGRGDRALHRLHDYARRILHSPEPHFKALNSYTLAQVTCPPTCQTRPFSAIGTSDRIQVTAWHTGFPIQTTISCKGVLSVSPATPVYAWGCRRQDAADWSSAGLAAHFSR